MWFLMDVNISEWSTRVHTDILSYSPSLLTATGWKFWSRTTKEHVASKPIPLTRSFVMPSVTFYNERKPEWERERVITHTYNQTLNPDNMNELYIGNKTLGGGVTEGTPMYPVFLPSLCCSISSRCHLKIVRNSLSEAARCVWAPPL